MKTVHVVEFGCNLASEPLRDELAETLKKRLEGKGLSAYTEKISEKCPPINLGTKVKTTQPNLEARRDWEREVASMSQWNVQGVVLAHHDSHGLCYEVRHTDGKVAFYDPTELEIVD